DPERPHADDVETLDDGIEAEAARTADDVGEADQRRAEESEQADQSAAGFGDPFAKLAEHAEEAVRFVGHDARRHVELADLLQQAHFIAAGADHLGAAIADGAVDDPRADRVHALDFAQID